MISSQGGSVSDEGAIDLIAMWRISWSYRYLIVAVAACCGVAMVVIALALTPIFRAAVVVTGVEDSKMGMAAGLANQLGGLAS